jgi:hypothetical protein
MQNFDKTLDKMSVQNESTIHIMLCAARTDAMAFAQNDGLIYQASISYEDSTHTPQPRSSNEQQPPKSLMKHRKCMHRSRKRKLADALEVERSFAGRDATSHRLLEENARLRQRLADLEQGIALARALFA